MIKFAAALLIVTLASPAQALPCWLIKASYAPFSKHGIKAAEKWARDHGYSEAEIKEAIRCLSH